MSLHSPVRHLHMMKCLRVNSSQVGYPWVTQILKEFLSSVCFIRNFWRPEGGKLHYFTRKKQKLDKSLKCEHRNVIPSHFISSSFLTLRYLWIVYLYHLQWWNITQYIHTSTVQFRGNCTFHFLLHTANIVLFTPLRLFESVLDKIKLIPIIRKMLNIGSLIGLSLRYSIYVQVNICRSNLLICTFIRKYIYCKNITFDT